MTTAALAARHGYEAPDPSWQFDSARTPVPVERWGKDHWSTFAYVETRIVDHHGILDHDRMRCDADRHPLLMSAKRRLICTGPDRKYPTRLKTTPGPDGGFGFAELPDHDDYDCLEDAIAAGLLLVVMPVADGPVFRDARGSVVTEAASRTEIEPGAVTGLTEVDLMARASWVLTELGQQIAGQLRAWKGTGGSFHSFQPNVSTTP